MNPQERFWAGRFGTDYTCRNRVAWEGRVPFWQQILDITQARSVLDVGCNAGWNLHAIRSIDKTIDCMGIDVNVDAVGEARMNELDVIELQATQAGRLFTSQFDLVCTSGVLIHVGPDELEETMRSIADASRRWVLAIEYEAEKEEAIEYRGNTEKLWKRPFGELYRDLGLALIAESEAKGFDRCCAWLMVKR